jgi:hypothetical protein
LVYDNACNSLLGAERHNPSLPVVDPKTILRKREPRALNEFQYRSPIVTANRDVVGVSRIAKTKSFGGLKELVVYFVEDRIGDDRASRGTLRRSTTKRGQKRKQVGFPTLKAVLHKQF